MGVLVVVAVSVGIIGENQVQEQFALLPAFKVKQHFHFIVVQYHFINEYVYQCFAVLGLGIVKRAEVRQPFANVGVTVIYLHCLFVGDCVLRFLVFVL